MTNILKACEARKKGLWKKYLIILCIIAILVPFIYFRKSLTRYLQHKPKAGRGQVVGESKVSIIFLVTNVGNFRFKKEYKHTPQTENFSL